MKKMITIHNIETGEVIEREMTLQEIEADDKKEFDSKEELLLEEKMEVDKAKKKNELLLKLGITSEEAALLLG
jgi:hypothetical protein